MERGRQQSPRPARDHAFSYELDADTLELIRAVQAFKERTGRAFPSWSELLQILRDLGYRKTAESSP